MLRASLLLLLCTVAVIESPLCANGPDEPAKPISHTARDVAGWKVQIDDRLLADSGADLGRRSIRLLEDRLHEITLVVPADKLARLQQIVVWLDQSHGRLTSMQYHPSADWLRDHGYGVELAKGAHIPDAARFASPLHHHQQPWAVLHELAHAYHDQVLGFEHQEIKAAWKQFADSGRYESVLHIDGQQRRHYALTNQKEFFAEMTEAYFGLNDFYPFHRAELQRDEPELFAQLVRWWGPLPGKSAK